MVCGPHDTNSKCQRRNIMKPKVNNLTLTLILSALLLFTNQAIAGQDDLTLFEQAFESIECFSGNCPSQNIEDTITAIGYAIDSNKDDAEETSVMFAKRRACKLAKPAAEIKAADTPCINRFKCMYHSANADELCTYGKPTTISSRILFEGTRGFKICIEYLIDEGATDEHAIKVCKDNHKKYVAKTVISATANAKQFCVSKPALCKQKQVSDR